MLRSFLETMDLSASQCSINGCSCVIWNVQLQAASDDVRGIGPTDGSLVPAPEVVARVYALACFDGAAWRLNRRCSRFFTSTYTGRTTPSDKIVATSRVAVVADRMAMNGSPQL